LTAHDGGLTLRKKSLTREQTLAANWLILVEMITAGHEANARRFKVAAQRLEDDVPVDSTGGHFIYYLLKQAITNRLAGPVSPDELRGLARDIKPQVTRIAKVGEDDIAKVMMTALDLAEKKDLPTEEILIVLGSVILGCLLDTLPEDLTAHYSGLMDWHNKTFGG
jgi:hypothetical protein